MFLILLDALFVICLIRQIVPSLLFFVLGPVLLVVGFVFPIATCIELYCIFIMYHFNIYHFIMYHFNIYHFNIYHFNIYHFIELFIVFFLGNLIRIFYVGQRKDYYKNMHFHLTNIFRIVFIFTYIIYNFIIY